jgi:hypothetical protein
MPPRRLPAALLTFRGGRAGGGTAVFVTAPVQFGELLSEPLFHRSNQPVMPLVGVD